MTVIRIRNPSLEFGWLPNNLRKGIVTPRLVLSGPNDLYGGRYMRRTVGRCVVPELDLDLKEGGVIEVCGNETPACLAHEYRHHWQIENGMTLGPSLWNMDGVTYEQSIVNFFRSFWWEMDALRFEIKHAANDLNLQWKEWIVNS
jgi:hypothetical protein